MAFTKNEVTPTPESETLSRSFKNLFLDEKVDIVGNNILIHKDAQQRRVMVRDALYLDKEPTQWLEEARLIKQTLTEHYNENFEVHIIISNEGDISYIMAAEDVKVYTTARAEQKLHTQANQEWKGPKLALPYEKEIQTLDTAPTVTVSLEPSEVKWHERFRFLMRF